MSEIIANESTASTPAIFNFGSNCSTCSTRRVCEARSLMNELPDHVHEQLFQPRMIKAGKHLFHTGDELTTIFIIKSGAFKTYLHSESGNEHIISFHMPGDVLGADGLGDYKHQLSVVALENSAVCITPVKKLVNEIKRSSSNWLMKQACQNTYRENQTFFVNIRNNTNAYARLAFFLIKQAHDHKTRGYSETEFKLDMKRGDIANYLGLTIETVSRVLHSLQHDHVLDVKGRYIHIVRMQELKDIAEMRPHSERISA